LYLVKSHNKDELDLALKNLLSEKTETEDEIRSNKNSIAVTYIKLGRLEEAENILSELLKKYPKNYSIVINLGTLYELQGKNAKALEYIKKALTIDPDSHSGSEWFHVKILEYKLKNISDDKISSQNILGLYSMKESATTIAYEVCYQLKERVPFTPAPNLLLAKVMQELGDFLADSVSIEAAYVIYETGMDYDRANVLKLAEKRDALIPYFKKYKEKIPRTRNYYVDAALQIIDNVKTADVVSVLDKGLDYLKEQEKRKEAERKQNQYLFFAGTGLCALLAGIFFYRRKKQSA
jgi:tetratricopeptide (TPR) repeat protein